MFHSNSISTLFHSSCFSKSISVVLYYENKQYKNLNIIWLITAHPTYKLNRTMLCIPRGSSYDKVRYKSCDQPSYCELLVDMGILY